MNMFARLVEAAARRLDPERREQLFRRLRRLRRPARLGSLRRTTPLSESWGYDRGTPIDRYYIEAFLERHAADIHGAVLEVANAAYTRRFGRGVVRSEVLDIKPDNAAATIVTDLSRADGVPGEQFDCFILTQTLQLIYEVEAAVRQAHRLLRPGGVLLVTVPVISRLVPRYGLDSDFWRFTPASCRRVFGDVFGANVEVSWFGNTLAAIGFLTGLAQEELRRSELDSHHDYYPLIVCVRAVKSRVPA